MAFRWHAVECPTLNAGFAAAIFQGIRTCIARKLYIFIIFQGGGVRTPVPSLDPHMLFHDILVLNNVRQRLRRACASVHSQYNIDGSITAFMLNGLIVCLTTQTTTWKKGPFVYKLT